MRDKKLKENTFLKIRKWKIKAMKDIFMEPELGKEINRYSYLLSEEELIKSFDFFNSVCEEKDSEDVDVGTWSAYFEEAWDKILSIETKNTLKREKAFILG